MSNSKWRKVRKEKEISKRKAKEEVYGKVSAKTKNRRKHGR